MRAGRRFGFCFVFLLPLLAQAQNLHKDYLAYIQTYERLAVDQRIRHGIPASITLAQGLLESNAGRGALAREANNHFGIKCHSDWTGPRVYQSDDLPNECFRRYRRAEDSYDDHARFLLRPRYAVLFRLDIRDYRAWARGLQQCGYATDRAYANKLIKLIEDYELYRYDAPKGRKALADRPLQRTVYRDHGLLYVLADLDDSYARIAEDTGFDVKRIARCNEAPVDFPLRRGDIVYLEKKHRRAEKPYFEHTVRIGESMHSISQQYALSVKQLYKLNRKRGDYVPEEGDVLRLR